MSFKFSQTSVKDFEKDDTCPLRWKSQWVDRVFSLPSSEDMEKGKYFEQLFLGGSAIAGEKTDLPRLKDGKKSVDQIRIEAQAERAKRLFDPNDPEFLGFTLGQTQLYLSNKEREGTLDIEAFDADKYPWVIDVKLTKDLTSDRSQYGWGNDWAQLDLLQQVHYEALYEDRYGIRPRIGLLVFDYSPSKRIEFGEIVISDTKRQAKELRFGAAKEAYQLYSEHGWITIPSIKECENCPLKCAARINKTPIVKKIIQY